MMKVPENMLSALYNCQSGQKINESDPQHSQKQYSRTDNTLMLSNNSSNNNNNKNKTQKHKLANKIKPKDEEHKGDVVG
jgi:uncharacterized membrane protein